MAKCPEAVKQAAKRIAAANGMSVKDVFTRYTAAVKKTALSSKDFLLPHR